ncbi:mucin-5AC-like [Anarrhichthys ocellatus]|uniref:mucin-5AC-like n=1 Tax=Anarrhichthys ocellatus TaxID=433405 RepID=UPI0012EE9005|nr:mucin-5AC-like [Anarrhichthys ocellatus]
MSADDFQTKYSSVMESMLKSAIAETTKLFETMVDELKAEISRVKKENEGLKIRCSHFENARNQPTVHSRERDPLHGPSDGSEKRDRAVQCDLVPLRTTLVEQCQPLHSSLQNQEQQCSYEQMEYSLQDHTYGEGTTQMTFILVKQEDSYDDSSQQSVLKQEEDEALVCGQVLSEKAGSPQASENEGILELPYLGMDSGLQGAQNQSSELEHSQVLSLAAIKDNMEEVSEVSEKEKLPLVVAQHQSEVESLEKEQPLVKHQQCQREIEVSVSEQADAQQHADVESTEQQLSQLTPLKKGKTCEELKSSVTQNEASRQPELSVQRRRGRPPKKAKNLQRPVKEIGSLTVSEVSLSKICSSEKEKPSESQQPSTEMEKGAIKGPFTDVSSANETLNTPNVQPRERRSSVTLQDAILLVEAMNQSTAEDTVTSSQRTAAPPQTQCVGTLETVDEIPAEPAQLTKEKLGSALVTLDATVTNEAQAHIKVVLPKQQHTVTPTNTTSLTAAVPTSVRSLQQHPPPRPLITSVAPSKPVKAVPYKIVFMPGSVSSLIRRKIEALSPTQLPTVVSTVVAAQKNSELLKTPPLSSVPPKTTHITSRKSLPVVPSQSTTTLTDLQSGTLPRPKITIIVPRQASAVASSKRQSQTIVPTATQESTKSAAVMVSSPSSQELSISVDTQTVLDEVAAISSQKKYKTLYNIPKQTASVSEPVNASPETCSSSNMSVGLVPTSVSPVVPPSVNQKLSAVVRLTRLPFPVSAKEAVLVSRLPTDGSPESQSILKEDTTQEKPSSVVISTRPSEKLVLSTDICPSLKESSVVLLVNASQMSEEPNDIQEKASLSCENCVILEEDSPDSRPSTPSKVSAPVVENSPKVINKTEQPALKGTAGEPAYNSDEEIISIAVQDFASSNDPPMEEEESAALIHLTPITTKDTSDPHLQMSKAQFLAQLAVTPVPEEPKQVSSDDSVKATAAETSTSEKKRLQKKSLVAQLRSHLKTRLQARRTETNSEPCKATETPTVNPKKSRLENVSPKNKDTTREPIPISPKDPGAVEDVAFPKKTTNDPTAVSPRRSGLREADVGPKKNVSEPSFISSRRFKAARKSAPVTPRKSSSGAHSVGSKTKNSTSVSRRGSTAMEESASPKKTKSTSVSPRSISIKERASPKKTKSTSVSPRMSSSIKESANPKKTKSTSVSPRRASSKNTKNISLSPKRTSSSRDDAIPKKAKSVRQKTSSLSKNGTTTKVSVDESSSFCRRRCTLPKNGSSSKMNKSESNSFSPRYSITTDSASNKNTKSETGSSSVRWPKLAKDCVSPRKTRESTPAKKPRLIQDGTGPKQKLIVVDAKKLAKAAKAKTIAKLTNSSQSKLLNGAKPGQLAENRASCEAVRKCTAKAVWTPPRISASKAPMAGGKKEPPLSLRLHDHAFVFPASVSLLPIPVSAPPVVSPLQPLSVIGRRLLKNQCGECGRVLSSVAALESHVSLHAGRRPFSCTLCGKRFPDSKGLKRHGRVHRNGRIHICQQCGKGFVYRFGLTKHLQMVHRKLKPFICQICNKGFFTKRDVEAHIRMHTGEKPFHCNLCEKKFARRVELNVHLRWHNGEKRHWCPFCGKGFLDFNNLKRHKYIHTGEKPHSCPHCPKNFTQSGHLKKHVKNVHKVL